MNPSLISQGVELMAYGMGTVFMFLILLVVATTFMSFILDKHPVPEMLESKVTDPGGIDPGIRTAIHAAIQIHRNRKR